MFCHWPIHVVLNWMIVYRPTWSFAYYFVLLHFSSFLLWKKFGGATCLLTTSSIVPRRLITARSELRNVLSVCFSAVCDFVLFGYETSGDSGTAERICAKFTGKTCLVPGSDKIEGWHQFRRPACCLCLENIFELVFLYFYSLFIENKHGDYNDDDDQVAR